MWILAIRRPGKLVLKAEQRDSSEKYEPCEVVIDWFDTKLVSSPAINSCRLDVPPSIRLGLDAFSQLHHKVRPP